MFLMFIAAENTRSVNILTGHSVKYVHTYILHWTGIVWNMYTLTFYIDLA